MQAASHIKESWNPPDVTLVHWDGKLLDSLENDPNKEERLPILVSGVGGVKLLGAPALPHKSTDRTGPQIAAVTKELLNDWKCMDTVAGMVFDTTSSNTGAVSAGCISIQVEVGRELLWFACRHHVGEVGLTHMWKDLKIEASKSPDIQMFVRFKEMFEALPHSTVEDLSIPEIPEGLLSKRLFFVHILQLREKLSQHSYE